MRRTAREGPRPMTGPAAPRAGRPSSVPPDRTGRNSRTNAAARRLDRRTAVRAAPRCRTTAAARRVARRDVPQQDARRPTAARGVPRCWTTAAARRGVRQVVRQVVRRTAARTGRKSKGARSAHRRTDERGRPRPGAARDRRRAMRAPTGGTHAARRAAAHARTGKSAAAGRAASAIARTSSPGSPSARRAPRRRIGMSRTACSTRPGRPTA
jgi:hypothetical protein